MIHELKRDHVSSSVPLNGANIQQSVAGVLAILKSCLIASFPDMIDPIRIRRRCVHLLSETHAVASDPSISNELHHQFLVFFVKMAY